MKIKYKVVGSIGYMTLSNPPFNELTTPIFEDGKVLEGFLQKEELKAAIVIGEGRNFCSGANGKKLGELARDNAKKIETAMNEGKALLRIIKNATIPTVAVIKGSCLGAGLEIALACDYRYASVNAMIGFPEVEHGILPGLGGTVIAPMIFGQKAAMEMILLGKMVNGAQAKDMNIVDACAKTRDVEKDAIGFLESLVKNRHPYLIRSVMESLRNSERLDLEDALTEETRIFCNLIEKRKGTNG